MWGCSEKVVFCKPEKEVSSVTELASSLILNYAATNAVRNKYLLFKPKQQQQQKQKNKKTVFPPDQECLYLVSPSA